MLNMANVEIELIPDRDMYIFFEKGLRGGWSFISNRYSKANKDCLNSSEPKQESKHIIYLDANDLYDYAISKLLITWKVFNYWVFLDCIGHFSCSVIQQAALNGYTQRVGIEEIY